MAVATAVVDDSAIVDSMSESQEIEGGKITISDLPSIFCR
jgi:hypothetical protein